MKVTSQLRGPNLYALEKLVNKRRGNDQKKHESLHLAPRCLTGTSGSTGTPRVQAPHPRHKHPVRGTSFRDWLFN